MNALSATPASLVLDIAASAPLLAFALDRDVPAGTLLRISGDGYPTMQAMRVREVRNAADGKPLTEVLRFTREGAWADWNKFVMAKIMIVVRAGEELPAGTELVAETVWNHRGEFEKLPVPEFAPRFSDAFSTVSLGIVSAPLDTGFEAVAGPVVIRYVSGPPDRVAAFLKPDGRVLVNHYDAEGNPSEAEPGTLTVRGPGIEQTAEAAPGLGATAFRLDCVIPDGARIEVVDAAGRRATSNARPVGLGGQPVYFGEIHWHTDFSCDGQRPMEDALRSARDGLGLDFAGPGDHIWNEGLYGEGRGPAEQAAICRKFDEPGRFVTIPGAEVSARQGHANIYTENFDLLIELASQFKDKLAEAWKDQSRYPWEALTGLCPTGRAMVVPHHSNADSGRVVNPEDGRPFWGAIPWPVPPERRATRLIEIVQSRGSFETEEPSEEWGIEVGGFGSSARSALMKGYRVGFTGGTDNHNGWPARSHVPARLERRGLRDGITGVLADRLDTETIFRALFERRCYATTGARIVADATLNGAPLGSELRMEPGKERRFHIRIHGTAPLAAVQVIHAGYVLADLTVEKDSPDFDAEWCDERPGRAPDDAYYYIRARQTDGHCVWLSPFWVDLP